VEIRYGERVDRIVTEGRVATGVETGGRYVRADAVVSNVDVSVTYPELLRDENARQLRRYRRLEPSSSGLVYYWGVRGPFAELTVNNIFFSPDYRREFASIFDEHRLPDDPTVYVNITSKVTPEDAPPGGENWFILVNAPYVGRQDWAAESARMRETVVRRLSDSLGRDVAAAIDEEGVMTPADIERKTMSYRGALYGIASNTRLASFARHPNRSPDYRGLYFCGGSAHPGGGMPLVMLSGKIAADLIRYDYA
jgi:diapolycopene oxygenase